MIMTSVSRSRRVEQAKKGTSNAINFTTFTNQVNAGQVDKVIIRGDEIHGEYKVPQNGSKEFHLNAPSNYPQMYDTLRDRKVAMEFEP